MSREAQQPGSAPQPQCGPTSNCELVLFTAILLALEGYYFADALRPGWVLSAADWLLATESFQASGEPEYEPANRLLTDIACQMEPWMDLAAREWQAGRVLLWNPYAGCGAPLLANAQSGVFSPINFIYFLTRSPYAWVAMAIVKLFIAGLGTFLLASQLGLGRLGRWFAGLCFPFSGFVVVWLQYPMGGVAVWLPLVLWLVERLAQRATAERAACLALATGIVHLGGHPETSAHILFVAALYVLWRSISNQAEWGISSVSQSKGAVAAGWRAHATGLARLMLTAPEVRWFAGAIATGLLIAAVQLVPLAEYLQLSQAWAERSAQTQNPLAVRKPRLLAMPALALPYVYGSYRRGHPHVEKALGVANFNEIAGGYTGLATIALLVPLAFRVRRQNRWISFWFVLDAIALATVYHLSPIDNLIRMIPVLNVTQNQRLLLVVSLAHCLLGGVGLDAWSELVGSNGRRVRVLLIGLLLGAAVVLGLAVVGVQRFEPQIRQRATRHFAEQARQRGLAPEALRDRAERQADQVLRFFPRYYGGVAVAAVALAALVWFAGGGMHRMWTQRVILPVALADLFLFGRGYNPTIPLHDYFPTNTVTEFLQAERGKSTAPFRVVSLEEEFPPNVLARYGLSDIRNYDAIEVRHILEYFEPLWPEQDGRRTSNSWTTWKRVQASSEILRLANVRYLISTIASEGSPASGVFQHGRVTISRLEDEGSLLTTPGEEPLGAVRDNQIAASIEDYYPGHLEAVVTIPDGRRVLVFSETFMPGWCAWIDGVACDVSRYEGAFMSVLSSPGKHRVEFRYSPRSFRLGLLLSGTGLLATFFLLAIGIVRSKSSS